MSVVKNAFWLSFCRIAADVLSFALFAAISRVFGPAGTGEYSYSFALGSFICIIATAGMEEYGLRQYAPLDGAARETAWRKILLAQITQVSLAMLILLVFLLVEGARHASWVVVVALSIYTVGWQLSHVFYVPAMAAQEMVGPAFTELTCRLAAILFALLGLAFWEDSRSLPLLVAGFPVAALILLWFSMRNAVKHGATLRPARHWRAITTTARGAAPFAASEMMNQFYARTDLLLITYMLGIHQAGLYATDVKFVEVGVLPFMLLGMAAYPLLIRTAAYDSTLFVRMAQDLTRTLFFLAGWLAVGITFLLPLLIVPIFGEDFLPSVALLPWFGLLALGKGAEMTFYRLLYAVRRQNVYVFSLGIGTVLIVVLNYVLIPRFGIHGAIFAGVGSIAAVVLTAAWGLREYVPMRLTGAAALRLVFSLLITGILVAALRWINAGEWLMAIAACAGYPAAAILTGLMPHPRHNTLFGHGKAEALEAVIETETATGDVPRAAGD